MPAVRSYFNDGWIAGNFLSGLFLNIFYDGSARIYVSRLGPISHYCIKYNCICNSSVSVLVCVVISSFLYLYLVLL